MKKVMYADSCVSFSDVEELVAIRLVTFSSIVKRQHLQENMNIDLKSARLYEAKALISACELARCHRALQHAISSSMHLNSLIDSCAEVALDISAAAALHAASVLWDQGEATTSIRMLQALESSGLDVIRQDVCVGRAELLATLVRLTSVFFESIILILSRVAGYLKQGLRNLRLLWLNTLKQLLHNYKEKKASRKWLVGYSMNLLCFVTDN